MRAVPSVLVVLLTTAPALADVTPFKTPSGNIECLVGTGEGPADIECAIFDRSGPPTTPRPAGCNDVWGYRFSMGERGVVTVECGRPGPRNTAPGVDVAQYGGIGKFGAIVCRSLRSGFECRNVDGHGFFLSRQRQSVF
ncbi:MAG: DUF6636 domain-containing protein [Alphaproteobacteria bacterium]